jgi:hypothetical protein
VQLLLQGLWLLQVLLLLLLGLALHAGCDQWA